MSKRIYIAGNILADVIKTIDAYPEKGMLANITGISYAVGGCVPNTAINLAKIDKTIPISAMGLVGNDEYGRYVLEKMAEYGIDIGYVKKSEKEPTSFSDVMNLPSGERTFFHARGANKEFCPSMIPLDKLEDGIFHIGYLLLLDEFDKPDEEYGTVMARFLKSVQEKGLKTSIDVVSDSCADYGRKIIPALRYCDYAIMNEVESTRIWNRNAYTEDGKLHTENIRETTRRMADCGVREKIIVHAKDAAFCYQVKNKTFTMVPSLEIAPALIKGSVGAGDSFCAGSLYGIYHGLSDREILTFASAAAACNLFCENSIDGMKTAQEIREVTKAFQRKTI